MTIVVDPAELNDVYIFTMDGVVIGTGSFEVVLGDEEGIDLLTGGQCTLADSQDTVDAVAEAWLKENLKIEWHGFGQ